MGGFGSGNRRQTAGKGVCEDFNHIDLRYLRKRGMLQPGYAGSLSWTRGGEPCGDIRIKAHSNTLELFYRTRPAGAKEWKSVNEHIPLTQTAQNFGGTRQWFRCPACHHRCLVLYGGAYFRCRSCSDLAYRSQREDAYGRQLSKARNIRARLGDKSGSLDDFLPPKPKGMHWQTYERLCEEYDQLQGGISAKLRSILASLQRAA